ncbi:MAG: hypothetical protein R6W71_11985, partial [Bacteroidales bacterium]
MKLWNSGTFIPKGYLTVARQFIGGERWRPLQMPVPKVRLIGQAVTAWNRVVLQRLKPLVPSMLQKIGTDGFS